MLRSLGRLMYLPVHAPDVRLASVVILIGMTVTPIPIRPLLLLFQFRKGPIRSVFLCEVLTIDAVFVLIPIVIVLVVTVVDPVVVLIVSMVFFLASVVLRLARSSHCWRRRKGCGKKKGTKKISIATLHFFFLLARDPLLENSAFEEYAFVSGEKMFDTAHLLQLLDFTPGLEKYRGSKL